MPACGGILGTCIREVTQGQAQNTLRGSYISSGPGILLDPTG